MDINHIWHTLGIAPTDDERAIKHAYAKQLKLLDPDDRAAFIALREAYEAALCGYGYAQEEDGAAEEAPDMEEDEAEQGFVADCWQSWLDSDSEDALLALLAAQQEQLQEQDIGTAIEYSDALAEWFYHTENHAPRAFAFAARTHRWENHTGWSVRELFERYPINIYSKLEKYPALAEWDAQWQQGFAARVLQIITPATREPLQNDIRRLRQVYEPETDLPESVQALLRHQDSGYFRLVFISFFLVFVAVSFLHIHADAADPLVLAVLGCAWVYGLLGAALQRVLALAGKPLRYKGLALFVLGCLALMAAMLPFFDEVVTALAILLFNLLSILMLCGITAVWHRMLATIWHGGGRRLPLQASVISGLILLIFWSIAYEARSGTNAHIAVLCMFLGVVGALFSACILWRTPLPAKLRRQWASCLLEGAFLFLFIFLYAGGEYARALQGALPRWMLLYALLTAYGTFSNPLYRQWHIALPIIAGMALFAACVLMQWPMQYLLYAYLAVWLLMPFAILLISRKPLIGMILPDTLRSFAQMALLFSLPLMFWQVGWYIAFAASFICLFYLLWLDYRIDEDMQ